MQKLTSQKITQFQQKIHLHYAQAGRSFAWRETTNPYHIFVSEIMLQQTQTARVISKYAQFIKTLPTLAALAHTSRFQLLQLWQGLGYNRRALYLQKSAQIIVEQYAGEIPNNPEILQMLPGIGASTAGSIPAFAYNAPTIFIETNIRTVFLHEFFQNQDMVADKEIFPFVKQTLDTNNARTWYYALTDYGVMLKSKGINPITKSKQYTKQSTFIGSDRQIRGAILRSLIKQGTQCQTALKRHLAKILRAKQSRVVSIIQQLQDEGFIIIQNGNVAIQK